MCCLDTTREHGRLKLVKDKDGAYVAQVAQTNEQLLRLGYVSNFHRTLSIQSESFYLQRMVDHLHPRMAFLSHENLVQLLHACCQPLLLLLVEVIQYQAPRDVPE